MDGQPVWLASVSVEREGRRIGTGDFDAALHSIARDLLFGAMDGIGDIERQRLFRMNVTMCLHRAATAAEVDAVPEYFHASPAIGLAGGPVEVLWETVPGQASTRPCLNPTRAVIDRARPDLWVPVDCEQCEPCRARKKIAEP